jgi:hypothetical protein
VLCYEDETASGKRDRESVGGPCAANLVRNN